MEPTILCVEHNSAEYQDTIKLRDRVLRKPLLLAFTEEELASESSSFHLACYLDGQIVACLVLRPVDEHILQMRQVAVADEAQGKGIGKALVLYAEEFAKQHGYEQMILHARANAIPFYLKLDYQTTGEVFEEVTLPHMTMTKTF